MFLRLFSFIFLLYFRGIFANDLLCSNGTVSGKCLCVKVTNRETQLPSTRVDCSGLDLKIFPSSFQFPDDLYDLHFLDLTLNEIEVLHYPSQAPSTIRHLTLAYNKINSIEVLFFDDFTNLRHLDLSHNDISSFEDSAVFSQLYELAYLDLSFNNIKDLPNSAFESAPLRYLDLSYNNLGLFLTLSKDVFSTTLGVSANITHLKLNNLELNDLHPEYFKSFNSLKHLEIMDNKFNDIPPVPYSVEHLDISGNNISYLSARYLNYHSLKVLRASRMPSLTSIHHYAFYNLPALEKLVVTDCPYLTEFTELAFGLASKALTTRLKSLILARNGITSLNATYKYIFRHLNEVDLLYNPLKCDCDLLWLQEFDKELFNGREIRCASPSGLRGKKILSLQEKDLIQCYPAIYGKSSHRVVIALLMIVIVFLIGLIFYLVKYPRSWLDPKHIGISPQSPYSIAPQEERH
ncbi:hypothetical protein GWI33_014485 [Rhynchophorus ferrugineus]|uniref:LRRCT domain-containing protein n=1 Tax=Rhynchophorus ferrugineus TaxID=354439 RepID=A0A834M920_RHYFE|nr:hypothetical protein GWI33_014485 [Rhynchophorus ferrugineus]